MDELPTGLSLRVGEERALRLPGLAASGYRWHCDVEGDAVAVALSLADSPPRRSPAASSRDEVATLTGRRPGNATLRFAPRRSWEPAPDPSAERRVEVTVVTG